MGADGTRGILHPADGFAHFSLSREVPPPGLEPFVERFWRVEWDLVGRPSFQQETLPYPCVNLTFQGGRFEVHGPATRRFVARLAGRGFVLGVGFTPAGFSAFARVPMRSLVDRVIPVDEAVGRPLSAPPGSSPAAVRVAVEQFLAGLAPDADEEIALVNRLIARAQSDRTVSRADDLARQADLSVRSLHRLFALRVGVGPKWIIRRSRVQEAADRATRGERVDWAATAQDLGYYDQAHFIRDFRAQVGVTPAAYARRCATAWRRSSTDARAEKSGPRRHRSAPSR